jgi:DNA-binding MarR family transcriptional regulator
MARQPSAVRSRELAVALHDISRLLPRKIDSWAQEGLEPLPPTELEVIRLLARAPGLSVGEVANELGLQPSNASAAIRGLVARGLLKRTPDGRDGRIFRLAPTPEANAVRRRYEGAWGELLRARLARMPPEAAAQLLGAADSLHALAAALSAAD